MSVAKSAAFSGAFIQYDAGGDSGVQGFDLGGLRDDEGVVHLAYEVMGEAGTFVADEDGDRECPSRLGQRCTTVRRGRQQADAARFQLRD
jgi:hypothetical protein